MSQEDLDQTRGPEASAPPVAPPETLAQALSEEEKRRAFFTQGIPTILARKSPLTRSQHNLTFSSRMTMVFSVYQTTQRVKHSLGPSDQSTLMKTRKRLQSVSSAPGLLNAQTIFSLTKSLGTKSRE